MSGRSSGGKIRLDVLLAERGVVPSREMARRLIVAGEVFVDEQRIIKPSTRFAPDVDIHLKEKPPYVSRGGKKLAAALTHFQIDPTGWICADVGASTGGFTDCLLQSDAQRVYAIDVGYGQLAWQLRNDDRVVVMERVNARYLESLPEPVDFISLDVSFISIRLLLPVMRNWLRPAGQAVFLVKPQFEAGKADVGKGGVVKDPAVHRRVLNEVISAVESQHFQPLGLISSPITGPAGNVEFLLWLGLASLPSTFDTDSAIEAVINQVHAES